MMFQKLALLLLLAAIAQQGKAQDEAAPAEEAAAVAEDAAAPAEEVAAAEEAAPAEGEAVTEVGEEACGACPVVAIQHYNAKYCTPVMDLEVDKCCPASYECTPESERGAVLTSCFYKNTTYEIGQDVPADSHCRRSCICKASADPAEAAKVECSIVECPDLYPTPKPGCRPLFNVDECCPTGLECSEIVPAVEIVANENATIRSADCFSEGLEYYLGDKIFFSFTPCQQCVCTEEFSGPFGPNCTAIDCGMEYRDREYLRNDCAPLYVNGTCCNSDWICPNSPQIIAEPELVAKGDETPSTHCTLGDIVAPRGTALKTYNCHVSCSCMTPPEFTCVQYRSCELALAAQKAGEAP